MNSTLINLNDNLLIETPLKMDIVNSLRSEGMSNEDIVDVLRVRAKLKGIEIGGAISYGNPNNPTLNRLGSQGSMFDLFFDRDEFVTGDIICTERASNVAINIISKAEPHGIQGYLYKGCLLNAKLHEGMDPDLLKIGSIWMQVYYIPMDE